MRRILPLVLLVCALPFGCNKKLEATSTCEDMCDELVFTCEYAAFPEYDSCVQGCNYNAEQGADVAAQYGCVQEAACDTFAIVECEHQYGLE